MTGRYTLTFSQIVQSMVTFLLTVANKSQAMGHNFSSGRILTALVSIPILPTPKDHPNRLVSPT